MNVLSKALAAASVLVLLAAGCGDSVEAPPEVEEEAAALAMAEIYNPANANQAATITFSPEFGLSVSLRDLDRGADLNPVGLESPMALYSISPKFFGGIGDGGSGGGRFSGRSGGSSGFSGGSGASVRFSGSSGSSSSFSGSSSASTGFSGSLSFGSGGTCNLGDFCTAFARFVCELDPASCGEVTAAAAECRREVAGANIPPEFQQFVCLVLNLFTCVFASGGSESAFFACARSLGVDEDQIDFEVDDGFGDDDFGDSDFGGDFGGGDFGDFNFGDTVAF